MSSTASLQAPTAPLEELLQKSNLVLSTREQLVRDTMAEYGCRRSQVDCLHAVLLGAARAGGYAYHLSGLQIALVHDDLLIKIMPDNTDSKPDSLAERWEKLVGHEVDKPLRFRHSNLGRGEASDCVAIAYIDPPSID